MHAFGRVMFTYTSWMLTQQTTSFKNMNCCNTFKRTIASKLGKDILHIAYWLSAHWTLVQSLGALVAGNKVPTRTEHRGDEFIHTHSAQPLVLNLEQQLAKLFALCSGQRLIFVLYGWIL